MITVVNKRDKVALLKEVTTHWLSSKQFTLRILNKHMSIFQKMVGVLQLKKTWGKLV